MAKTANIFAVAAVAVAMGTLTFTPTKASRAGDMYWFEVESDGEIVQFLGRNSAGENGLDPNCGVGNTQYCGLQLSEEDIVDPTASNPEPTISNIDTQESSLTGAHEIRKKP